MKLLSIGYTLAVANAIRTKRAATSLSLTGEETQEQLSNTLEDITGISSTTGTIQQGRGVPQERKIRQLKVVVSWFLQDSDRRFIDYSYGCHCDLDEAPGILGGGKAVDVTDRACHSHSQCYRCLQQEYDNECDGNNIGYKAELYKELSGEPWMECTNNEGSCRYNVCMCDKALAENLGRLAKEYDEKFSRSEDAENPFKRDKKCQKQRGKQKGDRNVGNGGFQGCCGNKNTFPFNQPRNGDQCCDGFEAKPIGSC